MTDRHLISEAIRDVVLEDDGASSAEDLCCDLRAAIERRAPGALRKKLVRCLVDRGFVRVLDAKGVELCAFAPRDHVGI